MKASIGYEFTYTYTLPYTTSIGTYTDTYTGIGTTLVSRSVRDETNLIKFRLRYCSG